MSGSVLLLQDVTASFGGPPAVSSLTISLQPGEIYALLGPNGAGKTTTINLVLGFVRPEAGQVFVDGIDVVAEPAAARGHIAYLPETVMLHPALDAVENLQYFALLAGRKVPSATARSLLAEAGLQLEAHRRCAAGFSKGMRQKVGVAVALAKEARLLLLDEPTSGLDASAADDFSAMVRAVAARGTAVLMATHDLLRVGDIADRIGILRAGRLVEERELAMMDAVALDRLYLDVLAR